MAPRPFRSALLLIVFIALVACSPVQKVAVIDHLAPTTAPTVIAISSPFTTPLSIPTSTPTTPPFQACSPLEGFTPGQVSSLVSNPYNPPPPGSDDPHAGVDLADMLTGSRIAVPGRTIQAVLSGTVSAVVPDRFPFGNALIIETPLDALPSTFQPILSVPTLAPTPASKSALTCPAFELPAAWDHSRRSLYLLYAHMQQPPAFHLGDQVKCGQPLGTVGKSGNALNPHLHLEVRVGPSGAQLGSLSHYSSSATLEELSAYCTWSTSGLFQLIDPMRLFAQP